MDLGIDEDGTPEDPELAEAVEQADADFESPMVEEPSSEGFDLGSILGPSNGSGGSGNDSAGPSSSSRRFSTNARGRRRRQGREIPPEQPAPDATEDVPPEDARPHAQFGGEVPDELKQLFTPKGFGSIMADGVSGFYNICGAPPLDHDEHKLTAVGWSYYAQMRFPMDWTKYQPEFILALVTLVPLMQHNRASATATKLGQIADKVSLWFTDPKRFWGRWFGRKNARTADNVKAAA